MVVDDRSRHELYRRLEEVLGLEAATTLIEHLPPVGWADVATKGDLAAVQQRLDDRIDEGFSRVNDRFTALDETIGVRIESSQNAVRAFVEHELRGQAITLFWAQVTVVMTMAALAFSLVRFT